MAPLRLRYGLLFDSIMVSVDITAVNQITREAYGVTNVHKRGSSCANVSAEFVDSK